MENDLARFSSGFFAFENLIKEEIGAEEFETRVKNILTVKDGPQRLFRDCEDRLFFYLSLFKALLSNDFGAYNMHEGARIVPVLANLSHNIQKLKSIGNIKDKLHEVCNTDCSDVDATLFEMSVAVAYKTEENTVEFIHTQPGRKTPDICVVSGGISKFVECKKLQRGSGYAYQELDTWYCIADRLAKLITEKRIPGYFEFVFKNEIVNINPKRIVRKVMRKLGRIMLGVSFCVANCKDFRIRFEPIDKAKFNCDLDPLRNIGGPSFVEYLTGRYGTQFGYKILADAHLEGPFVSKVRWASVFAWKVTSYSAIQKKARHVKKRLVEAIKQLQGTELGAVHILVEECNGSDVYRKRLEKNYSEIVQIDPGENFDGAVYLHIAKYVVPLDMNYDVEETIQSFGYGDTVPDRVGNCWFFWDSAQNGTGTLFEDHK